MAKFGISKEGADALRQLSTDIKSTNDEIRQSGKTLIAAASSLGDDLGLYESDIVDLVKKVDKTQENAESSIEELAGKLNKMAANVDALVGKGLK